ncbi:unnamed protein product [Larinioides sclopetarius]|uniref:Uncharacterized protein n=1 Tax=Larinioides sclopetarius TaxID=280406 RepID=A0AAV2AYB1_9ARAC
MSRCERVGIVWEMVIGSSWTTPWFRNTSTWIGIFGGHPNPNIPSSVPDNLQVHFVYVAGGISPGFPNEPIRTVAMFVCHQISLTKTFTPTQKATSACGFGIKTRGYGSAQGRGGAVENNGTIPFQRSHSPQPPGPPLPSLSNTQVCKAVEEFVTSEGHRET